MNTSMDTHVAKRRAQEQEAQDLRDRESLFARDIAMTLKRPEGCRVLHFILDLFVEGEGCLSPQELIYQQGQRDLIKAIKRRLTKQQLRVIEDTSWQS